MTWVKICGITNLEDALTAVEAGADALGFVFYDKSPRNVAPEIVGEIVRQMPAHVEKVGVFVGGSPKGLPRLAHHLGLTASQLHFGPPLDPTSETAASGLAVFREVSSATNPCRRSGLLNPRALRRSLSRVRLRQWNPCDPFRMRTDCGTL